MTCIAALKTKKGKIIIAADRRVSMSDDTYETVPTSKLIKRNGVILAGAGDWAVSNLILRHFKIPQIVNNIDKYVHEVFYPHLQKFCDWRFKSGKLNTIIVLIIDSKLYEVCIDRHETESHLSIDITEGVCPYTIGSGNQLAMGSLLTTEGLGLNPKTRLKLALTVTAKRCLSCDDNIDIIEGN